MDALFSADPFLASASRRRAGLTIALALALGGVTQALFWKTGVGLNFWIWDMGMIAATVAAFRPGRVRVGAAGAIVACVVLGFFLVRYQSEWTLTIAVPSTLLLLAALPLLLQEGSSLEDLSRVPARLAAMLLRAPVAAKAASRLPGTVLEGAPPSVLRGLLRGLLFGLPTATLFALLLASDTDFVHTVQRLQAGMGHGASFVIWSVVTGGLYLVAHALHAKGASEWVETAGDGPYRRAEATRRLTTRAGVSVVTWAMVVGQVAAVFAVFVAANLRHLFGGDALVRAPGSLTYSRYLHAGLYEVLFATVLSVCLVLAGHALLEPPGATGRGVAVPGGWLVRALEGALLLLTGVTVASCWQRLNIYEDAYGASHLRLGVAFVEAVVLGVVLLTLVKVVARGWRGHGGAVLTFGTLMAVVASGFNADAYVARTNVERAAAHRPFDPAYLISLSGDARAVLHMPYVLAHPDLATRLRESFCAKPQGSWRELRGIGRSCN